MENASKALLMAASVLVSLIVLSLGIYLVNTFKSFSQDYNDSMEIQRMEQFNAQFTAFSTRSNVSIHEIITLANYAKEFNNENNLKDTDSQYIHVIIDCGKGKVFDLSNESKYPSEAFISELLDGKYIYNLHKSDVTKPKEEGQYQYDYIYKGDKKIKVYYNCYKCGENDYSVNSYTGRVESIKFTYQISYISERE